MSKTNNNTALANTTLSYKNNLSSSALHSTDSLVVAFFITMLVHSVVIFGISFGLNPPQKPKTNNTLDIVLVQTKAKEAPEEPDYLAQADQKGGGELDKKAKPTSKNPGKVPQQGNSLQNKAETVIKPVSEVVAAKSVLSTKKSSKIKAKKLVKKKQPKRKNIRKPLSFSISDLQKQIIEKEAMLDKQTKNYAKRPKATYITASTRRAADAFYLVSWTKKIEKFGNLNYPDKAIRDKLQGQLILTVTIAPDGHLIKVKITKHSGHVVLDDAAKRIVKLAAPFAPVPKEVLRGNNRLVITRTWQFTQNSGKNFSYK